jgi:hypothetical protein
MIIRWSLPVLVCSAALLLGQSDRGTITGTVADQAGALVPGVEVVLVNIETGVERRTQTTETGNYTLSQVPVGVYAINVEKTGFRKFGQTGIRVQVAQTIRVDIALQVGATAESVTVTADASLLKTEGAEQSTVINRETINNLPLNFGTGNGAVRNPLSFVQLSPGTTVGTWNDIRVNGSVNNSFRIILEGQDSSSALNPRVSDESQPSVDALEEFTLQTSNFAAEFGQVGGGLFNFTARSGTNQFHGSAYYYGVNEALNSGVPYTDNGSGRHIKGRNRQHDFGGTIGGPVWIPKLYNGKDRTFFFFNYEMFRRVENRFDGIATVPTDAFRNGDFSAALTGRNLGMDGIGRAIMENAVYDPATNRTVGGAVYRDPFAGNRIPVNRFDPVAANVQKLIPLPGAGYSGIVQNFENRYPNRKVQAIPSIKMDHSFTQSAKISGYYSTQRTDKDIGRDALPDPISQRRDLFIRSHTVRINYDQTLSPTLLLHLGAGYQRYRNPDSAPPSITEFDSATLGFKGQFGKGFPRITGIGSNYGGVFVYPGGQTSGTPGIGPTNRGLYLQDKPTAVASATYIRGNHTFKAGTDWRIDTFTNRSMGGVGGVYAFGTVETGLPATQGQNLQGGAIGHPYASFLLGRANNASVSNPADPQYRRYALGMFAQDTWKITRNITLDYGLRWDYQPPSRELWRRTSMFAPDVKNPSAGNLPGGMLFEGNGDGRCNCEFADTYPYAVAPRLGLAWKIQQKLVFRAGWGISYGQLTSFNYIGGGNSLGMGFNSVGFTTATYGEPAVVLSTGMVYDINDLLVTSYSPGLRPQAGQLNAPPALIDPNAGRPPRMQNWSLGFQYEATRDVVVEAAYVGNRGAWFRSSGLVELNALTPERIKAAGLDISRAEDRTLLTSRMDAPAVIERGFKVPYTGFPVSATLAQTLRPFPQFNSNLSPMWAPLGNTWYDSIQLKVTKRYSYGLTFGASYTFSKNLTTVEEQGGETVPVNDSFNRRNQKSYSKWDQPHIFVMSINYQIPFFKGANPFIQHLLGGWTVGGIGRYSSGMPIRVPQAQNNLSALLFRGTNANRVAGEPLFLKDLNCHCIDPNKEFVLNPKAWSDPAAGEWGYAAAYYGDYRFARKYDEQFSFGKNFQIKERMNFSVRAEFFNIFNRTYLPDPDSTNALATQRKDANGVPIAGFGRINAGAIASATSIYAPRSGQIVARITF